MAIIQGILLAAGSSRRFGSDKLLSITPQNEALAVQSCRNLLAGTDKVLAVIRPGAEALADLLEKTGATIAICPTAAQGMGISLAYGVRAAPEAFGWLVALADMPWIQPATICKVSASVRSGASISVPVWEEKRGHPVGFSRKFRDELIALTGDTGAKSLLKKYNDQIHYVDCNDPGVLCDIDIRSDLIGKPEQSNHKCHKIV